MNDLISKLVELGYNASDLQDKTVEQLETLLMSENQDDNQLDSMFDEMEMDNEEQIDELMGVTPEVPLITDPGWNDYVMTFFTEDELYGEGGNPTVDGLRRVVELLIGDIVEIDTDIKQTPDTANEERATAVSRITLVSNRNGQVYVYCGAADACRGNIKDRAFQMYPVALAETRAEGRALRKALRLKKPAAEELAERENVEINKGNINDNQLNVIGMLAERLNINVEKVVNLLHSEGKIGYNTIRALSEDDARIVLASISSHQAKPTEVPSELIGYNIDWRT